MSLEAQQAEARDVCLAENMPDLSSGALCGTPERWELYREMVRHRLFSMVQRALPRTKKLLGEAQLALWFGYYLAERGPLSRYIRDVIAEFSDYVQSPSPGHKSMDIPKIVQDVLRYETACWECANMPAAFPRHVEAFDFGLPVAVNPTLRLLHVTYPVYEATLRADSPARPTTLGIFRHPQTQRVHTWTLNPTSVELVKAWQQFPELSCQETVMRTLQAQNQAATPRFIEDLCELLAQFLQHALVQGSLKLS